MNELFTDPRFTLGVVTLLGMLLVWLGKGYVGRLEALEREAVRKEDLKQLRQDLKAEHAENSTRLEGLRNDLKSERQETREKLNGIEGAITGTHRRIDDLYSDVVEAARRQ